MKLNDKAYNVLKWVALIALNAMGVFYKTISVIWELPMGEEVQSTCSAAALLLGTLLGISTVNYNKTLNK